MAYLDLVNELVGTLPGLSPFLAETYVNRAWEDIQNERGGRWGFLKADGAIVCPGLVSTGTVSITQYSPTVTFDADASAALAALGTTPGLTALQVRFGGSGAQSGLYNLRAVDTTVPAAYVATLDRAVQETTSATSVYQVYRAYVTAPPDFRRWDSLVDHANAIRITGQRLTYSSTYFDLMDPQRQSQGLAYHFGHYRGNQTLDPITQTTTPSPTTLAGAPLYELWPHPTNGQVFYTRYWRRGLPFVEATDSVPEQITESLVIQRALGWYAYPFALANQGHFPAFKGVNWLSLMIAVKADYTAHLSRLTLNDDDQALDSVWSRGYTLRGRTTFGRGGPQPLVADANWLQSHLVNL